MTAEEVGLSPAEYQRIVEILGRAPNDLELGLFGALWSEHCSYKNSKRVLAALPNEGPAVVSGPGGNAGVVRLTEQWDVAFKVESHNHPSYVEPVQGAATGVGGIIRDVVAMGARPVALMDSLRFGLDAHSAALEDGVVEGVGRYGNAIGVPTVGGEISYGDSYAKNPLVNVLCAGLKPAALAIGSHGAKPGAGVYLMGQKTGRDGIHGASLLASRDFEDSVEAMRPTVQVGDPFTGKLLMEATLAAIATGSVLAVQDLGAAGLTSSTAETAFRSGVGMDLDLSRVPCREERMSPYDIMLSETQERMLLIVDPGEIDRVAPAVADWELELVRIGSVIAEDVLRLRWEGRIAAEVPASALADQCPVRPAPDQELLPAPAPAVIPEGWDVDEAVDLLSHPDCRSRFHIASRYDWMIQTRTVWGPSHDAAILDVGGEDSGLMLAVSGVGRWAAADAWAGGAANVTRVIRQLAIQNADPLGLTDGLNAGNPDREAVYATFVDLVAGIAAAARALSVPVTGGNVSFHNETDGRPIWPTPVIGAVGRHPRPREPWPDVIPPGFAGHVFVLINPAPSPSLGGSVWESGRGAVTAISRPRLEQEVRAYAGVRAFLRAHRELAIRSVADGGVFAAVAKMLIQAPEAIGCEMRVDDANLRARLFNEESGQMVAVMPKADAGELAAQCRSAGVEVVELGAVIAEAQWVIRSGSRTYRYEVARLAKAWRGHSERG